MKSLRGTARVFGDNVDTDIIIPARHLVLPLEEMKAFAMEPVRPGFAAEVVPGDVIVAGRNFGCGSSREQAPAVLRALGIRAIVAESFARIFFRNAINLGIPVLECSGLHGAVTEGDEIEVDPAEGAVRVHYADGSALFEATRLPAFLLEVIRDGGLIAHLRQGGA
ncbi:MAG: 3-isopropylmalate dehydratase [Spirochaetota bacterium]